ncbi:hypothetical protein ACFX2B_009070 [Malus domestica]
MENYQGDLTDILRAGTTTNVGAYPSDHQQPHTDTWHFPSDHPMIFPLSSSAMEEEEEANDNFGDPFFVDSVTTTTFGGSGGHHVLNLGHHNHQSGGVVVDGEPIKRPCNIFSQMLQIFPSAKIAMSPCDSSVIDGVVSSSLRGIKTLLDSAAMVASDMIINGNNSSVAKGCLLENTGMQIPSPRNLGIKRRVVAM